METDYLRCERCETILGGLAVNTPEPVPCPGCRATLLTRVFPAFFSPPAAESPRQETVSSDEDASCFFHPRKKAVVPCANCGRFLCALCDLDIEGRHLCPTCVESARGKTDATGKILNREHVRYDYLALSLTTVPLVLFWPLTPITAIFAIYYVVRYWNVPKESLIPRTHARQIVALILALLELGGGILAVGYYLTHHS